nr:hypothetical protein [Tanacetum cinerariifolium]
MFPSLATSSGTEGPFVIEAEIGGHMIHRMYVNGGSLTEVLYEHCFNRLWPEVKNQMVPETTSLTGFSGETIWPLGQLRLLVTIGDADHSTRAWMNFMIIPKEAGVCHENFKVALHPNFPDQVVVIGGTLSVKRRVELCSLLKENLDIFAWQLSNMTGVPRSVAEHRLNIREGYSPIRQKKRGQVPERAKVIQAEDCYPLSKIDWKVKSLCGYPFKCFLDAYKGYHQIQLAESDEEKTAFHTGQGVYCYTKMPFGLKNAGATYQRLVDKAFDSQIVEGMFLGYMITPEGIKPCPDKTKAVLQLPSLRTIKEVQSLNGKLASLNRFLSKSAEKSLLIFKTLKKCIKKTDFHWTSEAEQAFKQLKQHLSELPLPGPELNYTPMEKLVLSLVFATKRLRRAITKMERHAGRTQYHIPARTSVKGQVLANFLAKMPDESPPDASVAETQQEPWTLFTDGSSCVDGSGAGLILTSLEGVKFTYALRFQFAASNNKAKYEALIAGLRITTQMGVQNVHVSVDSKLVANQVLGAYVSKEENMIKYPEKVKSL